MLLYYIFYGNKKSNIAILFTIFLIALTFHFQTYLRYIYFQYTLLSIFMGVFICNIYNSNKYIVKVFINFSLITTLILNILYLTTASPYKDFPVETIVGQKNKFIYFNKVIPVRNAIDFLNKNLDNNDLVLILSDPYVAGSNFNILHSTWYNIRIQTELSKIKSSDEMRFFLMENKVNYIIDDLAWTPYWGTKSIHSLIDLETTKVAEFGTVRVLKFNRESR